MTKDHPGCGYGVFPGFDNEEKKRIQFINSSVLNGGDLEFGYYDALKESLTPEQWELLDVHFYDTPEEALEARNQYAQELGYDLDAPRKRKGEDLDHAQPQVT